MGIGSKFGIIAETGNNIQTDGLVFYVNAAYKKSYPGTGTNTFNLKQIADKLKVSILYFYLDDVSTSCVMDVTRMQKPLVLTEEMEVKDDQSSSR